MSKEKNRSRLDRAEVKVFLVRQGLSQKGFCEKHDINIYSFTNWIRGSELYPNLEERILNIIESYDYPIDLIIDPGLRLQIEGATA